MLRCVMFILDAQKENRKAHPKRLCGGKIHMISVPVFACNEKTPSKKLGTRREKF